MIMLAKIKFHGLEKIWMLSLDLRQPQILVPKNSHGGRWQLPKLANFVLWPMPRINYLLSFYAWDEECKICINIVLHNHLIPLWDDVL